MSLYMSEFTTLYLGSLLPDEGFLLGPDEGTSFVPLKSSSLHAHYRVPLRAQREPHPSPPCTAGGVICTPCRVPLRALASAMPSPPPLTTGGVLHTVSHTHCAAAICGWGVTVHLVVCHRATLHRRAHCSRRLLRLEASLAHPFVGLRASWLQPCPLQPRLEPRSSLPP